MAVARQRWKPRTLRGPQRARFWRGGVGDWGAGSLEPAKITVPYPFGLWPLGSDQQHGSHVSALFRRLFRRFFHLRAKPTCALSPLHRAQKILRFNEFPERFGAKRHQSKTGLFPR